MVVMAFSRFVLTCDLKIVWFSTVDLDRIDTQSLVQPTVSAYRPHSSIALTPPFLALAMVHCAGCNQDFTVSGYTSHIHRTTRVPCRAIHHNELANLALDDDDDNDDDDEDLSFVGDLLDSDAERQGFARDLFGDYDDIDVGWPDDEELPEEDDNGYDDDEEEEESSSSEEDDADSDADEGNDDIVALSLPPPTNEQYDIVDFPGKDAAMPNATASEPNYNVYRQQLSSNNRYAPFVSRFDWEIARWAKLRGPSSSAFTELLQIEGVSGISDNDVGFINVFLQLVEVLGLSYKNTRELNKLIDKGLPRRPHFHRHDLQIGTETATMYSRDVLPCIEALYGNPEFAAHLIFKPERHFRRSGGERVRVFHDMHTGNWWWEIQVCTDL